MPNNLEALQTLKQSATEQKNELESTIKEIHKQSLQELNKSLKSTFSTSMENLENAIQNRLEKSVQKSLKTKNWIIITLTALVSMGVAVPATWMYMNREVNILKAEMQSAKYKVPVHLQYKDAQSGKKMILIQEQDLKNIGGKKYLYMEE